MPRSRHSTTQKPPAISVSERPPGPGQRKLISERAADEDGEDDPDRDEHQRAAPGAIGPARHARAVTGALPQGDPANDPDQQRGTGHREHEEHGDELVERTVSAGGQYPGDGQSDADVGQVGQQPGERDGTGAAHGRPGG